MRVLLFEDDGVTRLAPVTLGRPAYAIGCGGTRLLNLVCELGEVLCLVRPHLRAVEAANSSLQMVANLDDEEPLLIVNARLAPTAATFDRLRQLSAQSRSGLLTSGEQIVAALVLGPRTPLAAPADAAALTTWLRRLSLPAESVQLPLFEYPHDIIRHHAASFHGNLERRLAAGRTGNRREAAGDGDDSPSYREVADGVFVGKDVTLGEHLVTDSRRGPIVIDDEAVLGPFCFLSGPTYIGPGARLNEQTALKDGVMLARGLKSGARSRPPWSRRSATSSIMAFWGTAISAVGSTWAPALRTAI